MLFGRKSPLTEKELVVKLEQEKEKILDAQELLGINLDSLTDKAVTRQLSTEQLKAAYAKLTEDTTGTIQ